MKHNAKFLLISSIAIGLIATFTSCKSKNNQYSFIGLATTTGDLSSGDGILENDKRRIDMLHQAGFRNIDLSLYSLTYDSDYMKDGWEDKIDQLKVYANNLGMKFVQAHSQQGNPLSDNEDEKKLNLDSTIRSIQICNKLNIKNTVVHPGCKSGISKSEWFELNKVFYDKLLPTAESLDVNILVENSTSKNHGEIYWADTGKDLKEFIEYVNHPKLHVCWDTGHGNCEPNQIQNIKDLGNEIYCIHVHDNLGEADSHNIICCGTLDIDAIISALKEIKFKGYFTLECDDNNRNNLPYHGPKLDSLFKEHPDYPPIESLINYSRLQQETMLYHASVQVLKNNNVQI